MATVDAALRTSRHWPAVIALRKTNQDPGLLDPYAVRVSKRQSVDGYQTSLCS